MQSKSAKVEHSIREVDADTKAKARAAVEAAKQRQAKKATAKLHPKERSEEMSQEINIDKDLASEEISAENAKKELREKEIADRIKYVDKRSQARLAALRAKAADREAREKALKTSV